MDEVEKFWRDIWGKKVNFNEKPIWLRTLESEYCKNIKPKSYQITTTVLDAVISKIQNNKAPGIDRITGFWYKSLHSYCHELVLLFNKAFSGLIDILEWLARALTRLLPKNDETENPKNYRPIACQNIMLKLYTSCINRFLQDYCEINKTITTEQAGGKKDVWGCLEQLMINKMILDEVIKHKRSVVMAWLDYQKAFDSVPHEWLLIALKLAKVPPLVISAIETLMQKWSMNVHLTSHEGDIQSNTIHCLRGIFQGDSLSVLLFILSVNPLSFLLKKLKGYQIGPSGKRDTNINQLLFVDDLKLIAVNLNLLKQQLDLVTQFSSDIGIVFGESKCAFLLIDKGKVVESNEAIVINGVAIKPLTDRDSYKYLGQDENIGYVGPLNKARVTAEYKKRVRNLVKRTFSL